MTRLHAKRLVLGLLIFCGRLNAEGPVSPEESLALIQLPGGIRAELVAAEPQVFDPVALCFDAAGALYVVENLGYPENDGRLGRVALLRDSDGDGYFEQRTVFAEDFSFPNGIMAWRDGVIVSDAPYVYHLKDTDGDDVADAREILLSGFSEGGSTQLRVSHPTLGLDNWIHFTNGLSGGKVQIGDGEGGDVLEMGTNDLRYEPFKKKLATESGRAQFGLAFDDAGNKFVCSNRKHIEHVVLQATDLARNPNLTLTNTVADIPEHGGAAEIFALSDARTTAYAHAGTFTAACGLVIYRGDALPEEYRGNAFVCDPTGALVHRDILEPMGATYTARRARDGVEFLASPDNWFRPVFLANGPDGALYLCDMYRETIEHPNYLPPEIAAITDFEKGSDRGRIYRITAGEKRTSDFDSHPAALVGQLSSPRGWVRDTAHRLILERRDTSYYDDLMATLTESPSASARLHALHLLADIGGLSAGIASALEDDAAAVRAAAIRLLRQRPEFYASVRGRLLACVNDPDAHVRLQVALSLGDQSPPNIMRPLAEIARRDIDDPWTRAAVLSSIIVREVDFAEAFAEDLPEDAPGSPEMMEHLTSILAKSAGGAATATFLADVLGDDSSDGFAWRAGALYGAASIVGIDVLLEANENMSASVNSLINQATQLATDSAVDTTPRIRAVQLLGTTDYERAGEVLAKLLTPLSSPEVQVAAVQALGGMDDDAVAYALAAPAAWSAYTPPVKTAAMQALLKRPAWLGVLLGAMEAGEIPAWSVDPVTRTRLQGHSDPGLRDRAQALFSDLKRTDRSAVYEEYKDVLTLTPDPASGRAVFQEICSRCHLFNGDGYEVGPDLTGIRSQPLESILLHILVPNSLMLEGYETYLIETTDFENFSGIIVGQSENAITLRQGLGIEETIPRAKIDSMVATGLSMMPEELEKGMTRQQLRDLLGYLKGE